MIVEIDGNDFREIEDKIGGIRAAAIQAKMATDQEKNDHINNIIAWANEITLFLNNGTVTELDPEGIYR